MKRKLTHLLIITIIFTISGCNNSDTPPYKYPFDVVKNFENSCKQAGSTSWFCRCVSLKIRNQYTYEEFKEIELQIKAGKMPEDFLEFLNTSQNECAKQESGDGEGRDTALDETLEKQKPLEKEEIIYEFCNICGRKFTHNGFTEVDFGVWKKAPDHIQSWICSEKCGLQANRNSEQVIEDVYREAERIVNPEGNPYLKSDYYMGDDGKLHETKPCPLCHGERGTVFFNVETGEKDFEVCRACDGVGHLSY